MISLFFHYPECAGIQAAAKVASRLQTAGFQTFLVGGSVRDAVAGRIPADFDLVSTATPEEIQHVYPEFKLVGAAFGVGLLEVDGVAFEIATCREERNYLDGRHPELVRYTRDVALDVKRRDFTVNALLYDPLQRQLIDYVGGLDDLRRGIIRTVGDPRERFHEDYLRLLRAVRFAARMRFTLAPETAAAIREFAPGCARLATERVREELTAMLTGPDPARAVELLLDLALLPVLLPEVAALAGVEQPPQFHPEGDVFVHTLIMLRHMCGASPELAWSVLLHDVGKAATQSRDPDGRIRFFGHEAEGAEIAEKILTRLHFANREIEVITTAIRRHMHFAQVEQMKPATLRKMLGSPTFALELELNRLDCISCHGLLGAFVRLLDEVVRRDGEVRLPEPLLRGRDLVAAGFRPGPRFAVTLQAVFDRQLDGELRTREDALEFARQLLQ